jgi:pimeloyl-ACP methyl ester carboxylesterase
VESGSGRPLLLLHGYGIQPSTYLPLARLLPCRVVIPAMFAVSGRWSAENVKVSLLATLDALELERVSVLAHSFGGGAALRLAATHPERVVELVFGDTLGSEHTWKLAREAVHPLNIAHLATPRAARDFARSWLTHPVQMARAAWWGFVSERDDLIRAVAQSGIPSHVLWASRDTILSRENGEHFARALGASFTVANPPPGTPPVDHDWMFEQPELFATYLERLDLVALSARVGTGGGLPGPGRPSDTWGSTSPRGSRS